MPQDSSHSGTMNKTPHGGLSIRLVAAPFRSKNFSPFARTVGTSTTSGMPFCTLNSVGKIYVKYISASYGGAK